jgi:hypothetical protein
MKNIAGIVAFGLLVVVGANAMPFHKHHAHHAAKKKVKKGVGKKSGK